MFKKNRGTDFISTLCNNARCSVLQTVVCLKVGSRGRPKPVTSNQNMVEPVFYKLLVKFQGQEIHSTF